MSLLSSIFSTTSTQSTSLFSSNKTSSTSTDTSSSSDSIFGPSSLLHISDEATAAAANASSTDTSSKDNDGQDALIALVQQLLTTVENYLQNIGNTDGTTTAVAATDSTSNSDDSTASALAGYSGPVSNAQVEGFLSQVEDQPNISDAQKQQVSDMMAQYKNVPTTSAMLESIQATLASSGILPIA